MKQASERMNDMGKRIVVFGSYVTDLTGRAARFPIPGETVLGTSFRSGPGGKGSNQAVAAFRAGGDVALVTKLGKDAFGRMARDFYTHEGMDTSALLEDDTHETGAALIMVNEQSGQNMIMVLNGACNHVTKEDICARKELIEQADYLLVQMEINVDALAEVIRVAHDSGVRVILNPAPVQALDDEIMAMVDTVTPNETEAAVLTGVKVVDLASAHQAALVFLNKDVRNVIITLGGNGVYCTDGTREELVERIPVQAVDTTGAGDAFNGGFVTALSRGMDLFEAVRYGNCTGALSVTKFGTAPAMPNRGEIDALYQINYGG